MRMGAHRRAHPYSQVITYKSSRLSFIVARDGVTLQSRDDQWLHSNLAVQGREKARRIGNPVSLRKNGHLPDGSERGRAISMRSDLAAEG
jgi:hypothetical protein